MNRQDEDIDDILSSIMQQSATPIAKPESLAKKSTYISPQTKEPSKHDKDFKHTKQSLDQTIKNTGPQDPEQIIETPPPQPKKRHYKQRRTTQTVKKSLVIIVLTVVVGAIGVGIVYRKTLVALVLPQSPFSQELRDTIQYPLLYPTKPPLGYSIDKSSVSKGSNGVVVYNLKNPTGDLIGISLQPEPSGLNRDALLATLTDPRTITIPAGTTIIGTSKDEMTTSHTLTGIVWVIVRSPKGVVSEQSIEAMLSSLKEG